MRAFAIIFWKELRSFFLSPLAYVLMALFTVLCAVLFTSIVTVMSVRVNLQSLVFILFSSIWFWMGFLFLFPLITMRLFSEERKMGTLEGLFTAPVRTSEVVLAKYAAAVVAYLVIILPLFAFFPIFKLITGESAAFNSGAMWGSFLGLFLVGCFNIAIGILASSLTQNQLIAAMLTFVGVMLHYMFGYLFLDLIPQSGFRETMRYFSTVEHMQELSDGMINTRPIIYYLSFSTILLAFTHHVLEYRKWQA